MPHCSVNLYENVLRYNWTIGDLPRLLILGNILEDYVLSTPEWKLKTALPCLSRIGKYLVSDPLPDSETYYSAFNNTALQHVAIQSIALFEQSIWQLPDEINDEDNSELI
ncbi:hypothetical protein Clacol_006440 [Clathrus columnatus]|uniref:SRR1-like domain-containing protein n=1 Tax=Clathrus columnatus TaxID=1419009 RepID=A0AAV5AGA5_9AGAM|nr:hypothetical protein Clacol_006440 [Clathrus columnatus]